jgi:hypothetical protein
VIEAANRDGPHPALAQRERVRRHPLRPACGVPPPPPGSGEEMQIDRRSGSKAAGFTPAALYPILIRGGAAEIKKSPPRFTWAGI